MTPSARRTRAACAGMLALLLAPWSHGARLPEGWKPSWAFVQAGAGRQVGSVALGATWDWTWHYDASHARITGATEVLVGDWRARDPHNDFTQFGVTPLLRVWPNGWLAGWFVEGGIGANGIAPRYDNRGKHFSSGFQFGDHLGVGRRFGPAMDQEITVRFEHFSNCGLRDPNPGENFLQLRYSHRF